MQNIYIRDDYIKLGQALKLVGAVESGVDAKCVVQEGLVMVNNETELQRGKKLVPGDIISFDNEEYIIVSNN